MAVVFFFPWVELQQALHIGAIRLVPYERGLQPGLTQGVTQDTFDSILANYSDAKLLSAEGIPRPKQRATIVLWDDDVQGLELAAHEISARMAIGQYLTFGAITNRTIGDTWNYCNADDVAMIGQGFVNERPRSITIMTRRRDGYTNNYISRNGEMPLFFRPQHAQARNIHFAADVIAGLLAVTDHALQQRLQDSITVFNRANSDASEMSSVEIVLMRVAFETLLGASHEWASLRNAFIDHFKVSLPDPPVWPVGTIGEQVWQSRAPKKHTCPLAAWVYDFCNSRNSKAHGNTAPKKHPDAIWSVENHLLFASWLFPLMVKKILEDHGTYVLSLEEKEHRSQFEKFFAHDICAFDNDELKWVRVMKDVERQTLVRKLAEALEYEKQA